MSSRSSTISRTLSTESLPSSRRASSNPTHRKRDSTSNNNSMRKPTTSQQQHLSASNIKVFVRSRCRNQREINENSGVVVSTSGLKGKEVILKTGQNGNTTKTYTFDNVFGAESDQESVYEGVAKNVLDEMIRGYNCTIFAYGQTGTGKTYTMSGDLSTNSNGKLTEDAGIIPRILFDLFERLKKVSEYSVKVSFIELYNEDMNDLLTPEDEARTLKIYDDKHNKRSVVIHGMEEVYIKTPEEGLKLLVLGSNKRKVASTKCNDISSRSHSVFTLTVHRKVQNPTRSKSEEELVTVGKLNLVDLAGSENISRSGATDRRAKEAGMINQSLLTLGRVINSLVENSSHIPYRESKLTRLLQDSLGGQTKTCIIATLSPAKTSLDETISTLEYAHTAKSIKNRPQINHPFDKKALISEYLEEIERLRRDLTATRSQSGVYLDKENFEKMKAESESRRIRVEELEQRSGGLDDKINRLNAKYESLETEMNDKVSSFKLQLRMKDDELNSLTKELQEKENDLNLQLNLNKSYALTEAKFRDLSRDLQNQLLSSIHTFEHFHEVIVKQNGTSISQKEHIETSSSQICGDLITLRNSLVNLSSHFGNEFRESFESSSNKFTEIQSKKLRQHSSNLNQLKLDVLAKNSEIEKTVTKFGKYFKDTIHNGLQDITLKISTTNKSDLVGMQLQLDSSEKIITELLQSLQSSLESDFSHFNFEFNECSTDLLKLAQLQNDNMDKLQQELSEKKIQVSELISKLNESSLTQLKSELNKQEEIDQKLIESMSAALTSRSKERKEKMNNIYANLKMEQDNLKVRNVESFDQLASTTKDLFQSYTQSHSEFAGKLNNLSGRSQTNKELMDELYKKVFSNVSGLHKKSASTLQYLIEKLDGNLALLDSYVKDLQKESESGNNLLLSKTVESKELTSKIVEELLKDIQIMHEEYKTNSIDTLETVNIAANTLVSSLDKKSTDLDTAIKSLKDAVSIYTNLGSDSYDIVPALPVFDKTLKELPKTNVNQITDNHQSKRKLEEVYKDEQFSPVSGSSTASRTNSSGSMSHEDQENVSFSEKSSQKMKLNNGTAKLKKLTTHPLQPVNR